MKEGKELLVGVLSLARLPSSCESGLGHPRPGSHTVLEVSWVALRAVARGLQHSPGPPGTELALRLSCRLSVKKTEREQDVPQRMRHTLPSKETGVSFSLLGVELSLPSSCVLTLPPADFLKVYYYYYLKTVLDPF